MWGIILKPLEDVTNFDAVLSAIYLSDEGLVKLDQYSLDGIQWPAMIGSHARLEQLDMPLDWQEQLEWVWNHGKMPKQFRRTIKELRTEWNRTMHKLEHVGEGDETSFAMRCHEKFAPYVTDQGSACGSYWRTAETLEQYLFGKKNAM